MKPDFDCHASVAAVLLQFRTGHLPNQAHVALVQQYCDLAMQLARLAPNSPHTTHALRTLMSAKDDGLRALIFGGENPPPDE